MARKLSKDVLAAAFVGAVIGATTYGSVTSLGASQNPQVPNPPAQNPPEISADDLFRKLMEERAAGGVVLSGADIGFRLDPRPQGAAVQPVGQLVVRINGQWVEARSGGRVIQAR